MQNNIPIPSAVLFDFDGVVVNSFNVHFSAWSKAYYEIFNSTIPDFPIEYAGKAPILIAEYFAGFAGDKNKGKELCDLKGEFLHTSNVAPDLLPGIHEITSFLKEKGIPFGIASNATKQFIANSIKQLEIDFNIFTGIEDYKNPKPHPEAYLELAKKLGVNHDKLKTTWVFEDSKTGIKAAKEAGMIPVGISTHQPTEVLREAGSQIEFNTILDAFKALNNSF